MAFRFMAEGLRSGLSVDQSLDLLAQESPAPLFQELKRYWVSTKDQALIERLHYLFQRNEFQLIRGVLVLSLSQGVRGAALIEKMAEVMKQKREMKEKMKLLTMQTKISAWVVSLSPVVLLAGYGLISPSYASLFFTSVLGRNVLLAAAVMLGVGILLVRRAAALRFPR